MGNAQTILGGPVLLEKTVVVGGREGLHARPAAAFVKAASKFNCKVSLNHKGRAINAKSTIEMMMAAVSEGELLIIRTEGADEEAAMNELSILIEGKVGQ